MLSIKTVYASGAESELTGIKSEADAVLEFRHFIRQMGSTENRPIEFHCTVEKAPEDTEETVDQAAKDERWVSD